MAMSLIADAFTLVFVAAGIAFFAAGTLGLVRLPQTLSRIHALTKADNVGLALVVLGLLPQAGNIFDAAKMVAIWLLAQLASGAVAQVMAEAVIAEARDGADASPPEESRP
ncbi:monovalent cation/H(+) antiporter subunit G [Xanthobacter autotrophicus]|uniref:monovalent cation/H(+) antiporter subunit G n=1 Tax=Xanthobacter TaxID=279 RepID=UPI0024AA5D4C|nr:monovalent cation/H(+) antiporter subunit G [Xanthobacter autotrophicus]MDI4664927.1 monovalent cation/H(+) antiporter subunit G [Xanthobacter autotrophicus]